MTDARTPESHSTHQTAHVPNRPHTQNNNTPHYPPRHKLEACTTRGIHIRSDLSFREHIRRRTAKAIKLLNVMRRLGNSNGRMSPKAMRALYTDAIHIIFT